MFNFEKLAGSNQLCGYGLYPDPGLPGCRAIRSDEPNAAGGGFYLVKPCRRKFADFPDGFCALCRACNRLVVRGRFTGDNRQEAGFPVRSRLQSIVFGLRETKQNVERIEKIAVQFFDLTLNPHPSTLNRSEWQRVRESNPSFSLERAVSWPIDERASASGKLSFAPRVSITERLPGTPDKLCTIARALTS